MQLHQCDKRAGLVAVNYKKRKHPTQIYYILVYVEWAKKMARVNFVTIFGDLDRIKLWSICNNFNQFAHLSSASGPSNDVIKMAAIATLKCVCI